jgi:hypothetical protein
MEQVNKTQEVSQISTPSVRGIFINTWIPYSTLWVCGYRTEVFRLQISYLKIKITQLIIIIIIIICSMDKIPSW